MKQRILDKLKILAQVNELSYLVPDGTDYQAICKEMRDLYAQGIREKSLSCLDQIVLDIEMEKLLAHIIRTREKVMSRYKKVELN